MLGIKFELDFSELERQLKELGTSGSANRWALKLWRVTG